MQGKQNSPFTKGTFQLQLPYIFVKELQAIFAMKRTCAFSIIGVGQAKLSEAAAAMSHCRSASKRLWAFMVESHSRTQLQLWSVEASFAVSVDFSLDYWYCVIGVNLSIESKSTLCFLLHLREARLTYADSDRRRPSDNYQRIVSLSTMYTFPDWIWISYSCMQK